MSGIPDRTALKKAKEERDQALRDTKLAFNSLRDAGGEMREASGDAQRKIDLKEKARQHPMVALALAAGAGFITMRLLQRLPLRSVGITAATVAARVFVPVLIRNHLQKYQANGGEDSYPWPPNGETPPSTPDSASTL